VNRPVGLRWIPRVDLSDRDFEARHRAIRAVLYVHVVVDIVVDVASGRSGLQIGPHRDLQMPGMGMGLGQNGQVFVIWAFILAAFGCAANSSIPRSRRGKSIVTSLGLLLCADGLVHAGGGLTDLHFDFFVVLVLIGMYQDWIPFGLAVVEVAADHLVMSALDPDMVFSSAGGRSHPIEYSLLHVMFIWLMAGAQIVYWQFAHQAQEALAASEREASRLALVATYTEDSVVISDPDGVVEWVNGAFSASTGLSCAQIVGRPTTAIGAHLGIDPELRAEVDTAMTTRLDREFQIRGDDGTARWVHLRVRPIVDESGTLTRVVSAAQDITSRRLAEERAEVARQQAESLAAALSAEKTLLADVIAAIPHLVFWTDAHGRYLGANAAFRNLAGSAALGDAEDATSVTDGEIARALDSIGLEVLRSGVAVNDRHLNVGADGAVPRSMLVSVMPQHDDTGALAGLVGVAADVTRLSELERQVAQSNRLESIGQLAAGIAHEVNTPVQFVSDNTRFVSESVGALLALVDDVVTASRSDAGDARWDGVGERLATLDLDFLSSEVPLALEQSLEGLDRITQIVRALKDFSHPGQGLVDADLNRAVESTVQISRSEWKYVAELHLDLDPTVGLVPCYQGELKQVVLNLIVNAAHSIAERRAADPAAPVGQITVSTHAAGEDVTIVVADDGTGMTPEVQKRMFDPFFTTKEVGRGTGQGLSLAYASIVNHHGGSISVESTPGNGAAFTVTIPARTASGTATTEEQACAA
jgi:two-component system NtrC family sensor kinase